MFYFLVEEKIQNLIHVYRYIHTMYFRADKDNALPKIRVKFHEIPEKSRFSEVALACIAEKGFQILPALDLLHKNKPLFSKNVTKSCLFPPAAQISIDIVL